MSLETVRQQILDENKRRFSFADYGNDRDVFFTEVVVPLRSLRAIGAMEKLEEIRLNEDGNTFVAFVDIIGAVNLNLL